MELLEEREGIVSQKTNGGEKEERQREEGKEGMRMKTVEGRGAEEGWSGEEK